jgi:hypothetical protein
MLNIDHLPKAIRYLASLFASKNQDRFVDGKDACGNNSTFVAERASRTKPSLFTAGSFIQHFILKKIFLVFSILFIHPVFSPVLANPFQQGTDPTQPISIEVEHYHAKEAQGQYEWVAADQAGFSGDGAMQALPEGGAIYTQDYVTQSPRLDYRVKFNSAGTYYVWLRALATSGNANSVHIGLDGQKVSTAENIYLPVTGDYAWTYGLNHSIEITAPGEHILNVWMRESGAIIDKLVLSQDAGFTPADKGPEETPKANGGEQSSGDEAPDKDGSSNAASSQTILKVDFENSPLGNYSESRIINDFGRGSGYSVHKLKYPNYLYVVQSGANKALRVKHLSKHAGSGAEFVVEFPRKYEEATLTYRVKYGPNKDGKPFYFTSYGKMPRFKGIRTGSSWSTGLKHPDPDGPGGQPTRYFTAAANWAPNGDANYTSKDRAEMEMYMYYSDQLSTVHGNGFPTKEWPQLVAGQWHRVKLYVKMNTLSATTGGNRDGVFKIWLDGVLVAQKTDIRWRDDTQLAINGFQLKTHFGGGNTAQFQSVKGEYSFFDDIKVVAGGSIGQ